VSIPPLPPHLADVKTVQESVEAFNEAESSANAVLRYANTAVLVTIPGYAIWVLLKSRGDEVPGVETVRIHTSSEEEVCIETEAR
jgi:hypothetical protein